MKKYKLVFITEENGVKKKYSYYLQEDESQLFEVQKFNVDWETEVLQALWRSVLDKYAHNKPDSRINISSCADVNFNVTCTENCEIQYLSNENE